MTINDVPTDVSLWTCKTVTGNQANDDANYPGWFNTDDVYGDWPTAVVNTCFQNSIPCCIQKLKL